MVFACVRACVRERGYMCEHACVRACDVPQLISFDLFVTITVHNLIMKFYK